MNHYISDSYLIAEEMCMPEKISKDTPMIAKAFVEYFASQRRVLNKVLLLSGVANSIIGGGAIFIYSCSQTFKNN
jgi:hypothetical protein